MEKKGKLAAKLAEQDREIQKDGLFWENNCGVKW